VWQPADYLPMWPASRCPHVGALLLLGLCMGPMDSKRTCIWAHTLHFNAELAVCE
jgi:hypothetical protein